MYNGQTVSIKNVLWKVMRHPLAADLTYEEAAGFAIEAIRLLGAPLTFIDKVTNPPIKFSNYKLAVPEELIQLRGARYYSDYTDVTDTESRRLPVALRQATDLYHNTIECFDNTDEKLLSDNTKEFTFTLQSGVMKLSVPEGYVELSYKALPLDEDGYPLVPNEQKTLMAMEYYILYRFLEPLYDVGKITDKAFQRIDQKKCFYMGGAQNALKIGGIAHMETIMNTLNRLIINDQAHENFYKNLGEKERLRRYN